MLLIDATPSLKDLVEHITPQYAADWKVIGTLLDLPSGELDAIEAGWPINVKWCCNQMLEKWLQVDPTASWRNLFAAIESLYVSNCQAVDKGNVSLGMVLPYAWYIWRTLSLVIWEQTQVG